MAQPANLLSSNTSEKLLKRFLSRFESSRVVSKTIDRQLYQGEFNPSTDDTVKIKRPHRYKALNTADGDISSSTKNLIKSGSAFAQVQNYITVAVEYSQLQEAIKLDQLGNGSSNTDTILGPIAEEMAVELDNRLQTFIIGNTSHQLGTAGTAISAWSDVAQTASYMKAMGFPAGNKYALIDPFANQNLADAQTGLGSGNDSLVNSAWEDAMISKNFGGVRALMSNSMPEFTNGTYGAGPFTLGAIPTATYQSVKDTFQQTIVLSGLPVSQTGAVKKGMVLEFTTGAADADSVFLINQSSRKAIRDASGAKVRFRATVVADADSDGSGDATVTITGPAIKEADGQYDTVTRALTSGDAVTIVSGAADSDQSPNLFYHEQAFSLATIQLPKLHALDSRIINHDGISIRMHAYADGDSNTQKVRFDLLPAFACNNPFMAGQFYGNP